MSGTSNRGFASMNRDRQREIASKGGKAAHQKGTAHEFTSEEARRAGRKGGESRSANAAARRSNPAAVAATSGASERSNANEPHHNEAFNSSIIGAGNYPFAIPNNQVQNSNASVSA